MIDTKRKNEGVIVTGAASGIGKAIADMYLANGYDVIGLDIVHQKTNYPIIICDVSNESSVAAAFALISERFSAIRYLINCAGIFSQNTEKPLIRYP